MMSLEKRNQLKVEKEEMLLLNLLKEEKMMEKRLLRRMIRKNPEDLMNLLRKENLQKVVKMHQKVVKMEKRPLRTVVKEEKLQLKMTKNLNLKPLNLKKLKLIYLFI